MGLADQYAHRSDEIALELPKTGQRIVNWTEYSFNSHYQTPADAFSFTLGGASIDAELLAATAPTTEVRLTVNGRVTATGFIDRQDIGFDRSGGTALVIEGRDKLGQAVDASVNPQLRFAPNMTLEEILIRIFVPYGFPSADDFVTDNAANRNVITGAVRGIKRGKKGKVLKNLQHHQLQPFPNESVYNFAQRIVERHGMRIWLSADGQQLVCGAPDYDSEPLYFLRRTKDGRANIISGGVTRDYIDLPTIVFARGWSGGGVDRHSQHWRHVLNPIFLADHSALLASRPDSVEIKLESFIDKNGKDRVPPVTPVTAASPRPIFFEDRESRTAEQLEHMCRLQMSNKLQKAVKAVYTVEGHTCDGAIWAIDTIVNVEDDVAKLYGPMWVMSRTLKKSRKGGTTTTLELIPAGALEF